MKKVVLTLILIFITIYALSQYIVYDCLIGNKNYWRRIKVGENETILNTYFQNQGIISKSNILMAAGIWDGLVENIDYKIIPLDYEVLTIEFRSDEMLNLILYKYQYNENYSYNFLGLRKAKSGDDLFTGKYLFVCPIPLDSKISVYNGLGSKRKLFLSMNGDEIDENSYTDYNINKEVTFKIINGKKRLMQPIVKNFIINENDYESRIVAWPNPVKDMLHIKILENPGLILRIHTLTGLTRYESLINSEITDINLSSYVPGTYVLVFTDNTNTSILHTIKIIKR